MTCPVEHYRDPDRPRRTSDGYAICGGCLRGLQSDLAALPKLHEDLAQLHNAKRGTAQTKISGSMGARLPIAVSVADARKDLKDTLMAWAVHAHREASSAAVLHDSTASAARWLAVNADWAARQDWAPGLVTAIRYIRSRAVSLLDPRPCQRFPVPGRDGLCVREAEAGPCPGRLWVAIPASQEADSTITCDTCGQVYSAVQWMRLGHLIHARRTAAA